MTAPRNIISGPGRVCQKRLTAHCWAFRLKNPGGQREFGGRRRQLDKLRVAYQGWNDRQDVLQGRQIETQERPLAMVIHAGPAESRGCRSF